MSQNMMPAVELRAWNQRYGEAPASELIELAIRRFPGQLALASSFGPEDLVLMHMTLGLEPRPSIFVLDTGRLPPETYDLIELWRLRYGLNLGFYYPDAAQLETFVTSHGPNAFYENRERRQQCCHIRKVQPLERALQGKLAWLTGLRREQSPTRTAVETLSLDAAGRVKISPLLHWTRSAVWSYIKGHDLPYNPLHDRGYASIGCAPCTRAIEAHEDERAGRWWWEHPNQKECGLHSPLKGEQHASASL